MSSSVGFSQSALIGCNARIPVLSPRVGSVVLPRESLFVPCAGGVSGEFVMSYPPGIPILAPGERVTPEIVAYIRYARDKGCTLTGPEAMDVSRLNIVTEVLGNG